MTKMEQLEHDIMALNRSELSAFREWFQNHLADEWDKQIEDDLEAGRLDTPLAEVDKEHEAGLAQPL